MGVSTNKWPLQVISGLVEKNCHTRLDLPVDISIQKILKYSPVNPQRKNSMYKYAICYVEYNSI